MSEKSQITAQTKRTSSPGHWTKMVRVLTACGRWEHGSPLGASAARGGDSWSSTAEWTRKWGSGEGSRKNKASSARFFKMLDQANTA